ncbi:YoaK family protein [Streptomyces sp. HNM0574]|uniref:YoaK family protein n=1 Tax=Streptomyces sp. HNM0574 TaxID=2714954 RepID=UPI00146CB70F|nr:YoaK family protein [Streptomyces sp. HNM0574]NLU69019.1 DUF1275 domain-containing protein [Streptomyces sp. HNM0574]
MPRTEDAEDARRKRFILITAALLAAIAGFVNSVFLTSLIYPVSHVTGSLSQSGMSVVAEGSGELGSLVTILLAFFAGGVAAGVLLGSQPPATGRRFGLALLAEAALLGAASLVVSREHLIWAVAAAAAACGLQNGMFSNYRGMVLRTSHMTGTLTDLGVLVGSGRYRRVQAWRGLLLTASLLTFVAGGIVGACQASTDGLTALRIPALCCAVLGLGYAIYRHHQRLAGEGEHAGPAVAPEPTPNPVPTSAPRPAPRPAPKPASRPGSPARCRCADGV